MAEKKDLAMFIAPFAAWIVLQNILPATAEMYAVRSVATAALLCLWMRKVRFCKRMLWGVPAGLLVAAFWILPENCDWYRTCVLWPFGFATPIDTATPYAPETCGWPLTAAKLLGSAFVIAPAEELFFRSFLYRWIMRGDTWRDAKLETWNWSAALWTAFVFSLEHSPRFVVAFLCAMCYQFAAKKGGIAAAITAHVATNLLLAVYVIAAGEWHFW
ncbi:MAG: CAAX prenyl protease-related protein [Kiritimatiellae bacterium]|nr:CAAX prenyl protease-related protein [Kiritimatiellia bacterium]